ncbi:hypothetical protein Barb6XT_01425 [Bacteroidales bacterium Barb6XT]|nr:hypothetical protein Barb6XT_01425 [Bacteroidales bacterium Barb6XT]
MLKAAVICSLLSAGIYSAHAVEVDKSAAVAAIGVESDVTPSGSVIYSIAFESYQATHGPQPSLGLTYSSTLGDAVAGRGWSLVGISAIVRTQKNIYYDGISRVIQNDENDPFMLDGIRLIRKSNNYGAQIINYVMEQGLTRVKAHVSNFGAICYFDVFYPNGAVATFGFSTNTSNCNVYPLTKIKDRFGDCMDLAYTYSNNRYLLSEIKYFYDANGVARCKVTCDYKDRPESLVFYENGVKVAEDKLLSAVTTYYGSTPLRTYKLDYEMIYNASVLSSVSLNVRGKDVNPVRFSYGTGEKLAIFQSSTVQLPSWESPTVEPGRFAIHQGKFELENDNTGFIFYEADGAYVIDGDHYTNLYKEDTPVRVYASLTADHVSSYYTGFSMGKGFIDCFPANVDGEGAQEIVKVNTEIVERNGEKTEEVTFTAYYLEGTVFKKYDAYTRTYSFPLAGGVVIPKTFQPTDFDGDGIDEIFITTQNAPLGDKDLQSKIYILGLNTTDALYAGTPENYKYNIELPSFEYSPEELNDLYGKSDRLFMSDFNGDGQIDLSVINNEQGLTTYSVLKSDDKFYINLLSHYSDLTRTDLIGHDVLLGNLNADRCTDIVITPEKGSISPLWKVLYAAGRNTFEIRTFDSLINSAGRSFFLHDINSDGFSDLVCDETSTDNARSFSAVLTKDGVFAIPIEGRDQLPYNCKLFTSDIKTHSRIPDQFLALNPQGEVTKYAFQQNGFEDLLLTTFTNSYGVEEHSEYELIDRDVPFYTAKYDAPADYENLNSGIRVVTHKTVTYKDKTYSNLAYRYENGIFHKKGLGFLGFAKFTEVDSIKNVSKATFFDPVRKNVINSMETYADRVKVYQVKNTWEVNPGVVFDRETKIHQLKSQTVDILKGDTVTVTFGQYDKYDNLLYQTTDYGNGLSESDSTTYQNVSLPSFFFVGIPLEQTSVSRNLQSSFPVSTVKVVYEYNDQYLPVRIQKYTEGNRVSEEIKEYDEEGKCIKEKDRSYEQEDPFVTSYRYNSLGYQTVVTDPFGHESTAAYDHKSGMVIEATDHRGNVVKTKYDEFDRVLLVENSDGSSSTASYFWCTDESKGLYAQAAEKSNGEKAVEYYDALNRVIRTEALRFDGKTVCTVTRYDEKGRPSTSYPFIEE